MVDISIKSVSCHAANTYTLIQVQMHHRSFFFVNTLLHSIDYKDGDEHAI